MQHSGGCLISVIWTANDQQRTDKLLLAPTDSYPAMRLPGRTRPHLIHQANLPPLFLHHIHFISLTIHQYCPHRTHHTRTKNNTQFP